MPSWPARPTWRRSQPRCGPATWAFPAASAAAAEAARAAPPAPGPPRAVDVLLDAFALRLTEGYAAAAPTMARALELVLALDAAPDLEADRGLWLAAASASQMAAQELWDAEPWHALTARVTQFARETGAGALAVRAHLPRRPPLRPPASWPRRRG